MAPILRLYEDVLPSDGGAVSLPALPRLIFVVHGAVTIADRSLHDDEAWHGDGAAVLTAGKEGTTLWRWELAGGKAADGAATAKGVRSLEKLSARLDTLPQCRLLLRGDSVAFPPGGCAYLHRHQGPGIRCQIEGGIRWVRHVLVL